MANPTSIRRNTRATERGRASSVMAVIRSMTAIIAITMTGSADAADLEDNKPFVSFQIGKGAAMRASAYMQARMEYGDLAQGEDLAVRPSDFDLYFRRARLGFFGTAIIPGLEYGLSFAGDESIQSEIYSSYSNKSAVALSDAYLKYKFTDAVVLKFGKDKLPYSRIYLTSSSKQLFSERPYYTYALRDYFSSYTHSHLSLSGRLMDDTLAYNVAAGRAWRHGDRLDHQTGPMVITASPELVARLEWSPPGWIESNRGDAHLGLAGC